MLSCCNYAPCHVYPGGGGGGGDRGRPGETVLSCCNYAPAMSTQGGRPGETGGDRGRQGETVLSCCNYAPCHVYPGGGDRGRPGETVLSCCNYAPAMSTQGGGDRGRLGGGYGSHLTRSTFSQSSSCVCLSISFNPVPGGANLAHIVCIGNDTLVTN